MAIGRHVRNWGLSLVLLLFFVASLVGQVIAGFSVYNDQRRLLNLKQYWSITDYMGSGHFISSLSENMESEFLQMAAFVFLTVFLYQKGSAESKKPKDEMTIEDRKRQIREHSFHYEQRRRRPILWRLYENSLSLSLMLFFVIFFLLHAYGSLKMLNERRLAWGESPLQVSQIFSQPDFWFESFQNWQSEFFSIAMLGVLSIFLRQYQSPQSKLMTDPHWKTGGG